MEYIDLLPEDSRLTTFPIVRQDIFDLYQKAKLSLWTPEEIKVSTDVTDYDDKLTADMRHFVDYVLAFFAASDGIVNINLAERFKKDIPIIEVTYFYNLQIAMEDIHAHTYSILLHTIVRSEKRRNELFNAIENIPTIKKMSQYMFECINSDAPLPERLLRMACVEGIFFTGCFCAIYWLQKRGLMPGLGLSNSFIARDECLHTIFALYLYFHLIKDEKKLSTKQIHDIFTEAVNIAKEFIHAALPVNLPEMNAKLMCDYIENQADNLLALIHVPLLYGTKHILHFMDMQNMDNFTNYFERRVSEYSKAVCVDAGEWEAVVDF